MANSRLLEKGGGRESFALLRLAFFMGSVSGSSTSAWPLDAHGQRTMYHWPSTFPEQRLTSSRRRLLTPRRSIMMESEASCCWSSSCRRSVNAQDTCARRHRERIQLGQLLTCWPDAWGAELRCELGWRGCAGLGRALPGGGRRRWAPPSPRSGRARCAAGGTALRWRRR